VTIAPTKRPGLSVLPSACVSTRKEERRELLTARGDWILSCRRAVRQFGDVRWRTGSFSQLRAWMVSTKRNAVLWVSYRSMALHESLGEGERAIRIVQYSVRAESDGWRRSSASTEPRTTASQRKRLPRRWTAWSRLCERWHALGTRWDPKRFLRSSASRSVWRRFILVEGASRTVRQGVLRESSALSGQRGLASVPMVGPRAQHRLRYWKRAMGTNKAASGRYRALRSGRSGCWVGRSRGTRGCRVQQRMVLVE
jgi:hypothetical protein